MSDFRPSPFQTIESVKFGDSSADSHEVIGSFDLEGPISFSKVRLVSDQTITATITDSVIFCSHSANNQITVNLPSATTAGAGFVLFIKVVDSGSHTLILSKAAGTSDTIEGAATKTFADNPGTGVILLSDGADKWHLF